MSTSYFMCGLTCVWSYFDICVFSNMEIHYYYKVIEPGPPYVNCSRDVGYKYTTCLGECEQKYIIRNCSCKEVYMQGNHIP